MHLWLPPRFMQAYMARLAALAPHMPCDHIANLVWALSEWGFRPESALLLQLQARYVALSTAVDAPKVGCVDGWSMLALW